MLSLGQSEITIPVETTYALFALIASLISFSIVKINISFSYYFFVMTRALSQSDEQTQSEQQSLSKVKTMIYLTLMCPLLITFLFVDDLAYNMLKDYISEPLW